MHDLLERLEQSLARARRHGRAFALLRLQGSPAEGDPEGLESSLRAMVRREDVLSRLSEHDLALLVEDLRHVADAFRISGRLRERGRALGFRLRAGIAHSATGYAEAAAMFEHAESALGQVAESGEGERMADPALDAQARARLDFEGELRAALSEERLEVHYQPIVDLSTGRVSGFEALVRWPHPERGLLLPEAFLEMAEESGLVAELDRLVLRRALERLRSWSDRYPVRLSLNLSSGHFDDVEGTERLLKVLTDSRAPLARVRLDVAEDVVLNEHRRAALERLRSLNIGFHLDDFGVGSSSFHCLRTFPFECLKIDRSLVFEMESEENCELIAALLRVAGSLGMRTIAEGVVTHAQLEELRSLGCREAQGFLFSPALDEAAATRIVAEDLRW